MSQWKLRRMVQCLPVLVVLGILPALAQSTAGDSKPIDWRAVHEISSRGIDRFYRLETDAAIQDFDSVARMAPGDPRGYFFKCIIHFSLYALERDREQFDAFMKESEHVIVVCEQLLDNNGDDATAKFYLGGIYGYRGMMWQTEGSLVKAVTEGRKGYLYLEEAVDEKPDLYDAHMGFGLFRYLVAKAPRSLHWMMKLLGITPDLEGGLQMLKTAAERGVYTRNEARLYLSQFLFTEHRREEAFRYLNELCAEYPENTLFLILRASWLQRTGRTDEAMADALKAIRQNAKRPIHYVEDIAFSTLGSIHFARNEFAESRKYYALYVDSLRNPERVWNWTWYRIGVAHELGGDREGALAAFRRVRNSEDVTRPRDAYYFRRAQYHVKHPISEAEGLVIRAGNEQSNKHYDAALQIFARAVDASHNDPEVQSRALLGLMQTRLDQERYQAIEQLSRQLFALRPEREAWVIPHGYFTLGQAYARLGRIKDARNAFDMVDEYDDYDFQDQLESRVEDELEKLDKISD